MGHGNLVSDPIKFYGGPVLTRYVYLVSGNSGSTTLISGYVRSSTLLGKSPRKGQGLHTKQILDVADNGGFPYSISFAWFSFLGQCPFMMLKSISLTMPLTWNMLTLFFPDLRVRYLQVLLWLWHTPCQHIKKGPIIISAPMCNLSSC